MALKLSTTRRLLKIERMPCPVDADRLNVVSKGSTNRGGEKLGELRKRNVKHCYIRFLVSEQRPAEIVIVRRTALIQVPGPAGCNLEGETRSYRVCRQQGTPRT
jgi:hypothetical protein